MPLAIFDLDETLICADSDHEWGQFVSAHNLVDATKHNQQNDYFYEQYKRGELQIDEYLEFACSILTRYSLDELHQFRRQFMETVGYGLILPKARQLVEKHRDAGDILMVITSTIDFITAPFVESLNIDTLIAPNPEMVNNRYTGKIVGVPSFAAGKVTRLKQWLAENNSDLTGSHFYSDSHNDLPLLRLVDHPIAVDPDAILKQHARENQWQIMSLRKSE